MTALPGGVSRLRPNDHEAGTQVVTERHLATTLFDEPPEQDRADERHGMEGASAGCRVEGNRRETGASNPA
jgi:hypothetical protein